MLNRVEIIGNVGNDPDIRKTQSGDSVVNLSIATTERWKDKNTGTKKEKTEWHRVVVWNQGLVRVIDQYVRKGSKVYIAGKLETKKWQDSDGNDRYTTEINMTFDCKLILLDSKEKNEGDRERSYDESPDLDDEIPF